MLKGKLLAIISGSMSVVVAATTALTLGISGPRNTMSLNALSDNEAVAYGVSGLFNSATSGVDTVTEVIDTISENKAALSLGFNINEIQDLEELSGLGANLDINFDIENAQFSLDANAVYGTVELFNTILYFDNKEMALSIPTFFNGIIKVAYDNLEEDIKNSFFGSVLESEGIDFEEYKDELMAALDEAATTLPKFEYEFDYEAFADELSDVINDAYKEAVENMDVTDNGKKPLNGGNYQCYTASISVADLSYIIRDVLVYVLESDEFQDYLDYVMEYVQNLEGNADSDYGDLYGEGWSDLDLSYGEQLGSMAPMIKTYWSTIVTELETVLGKNIEFTIYLTDTVETAGFEFYASINSDNSLNYKKDAITGAKTAVVIKCDFTGGKEIGDYSYMSVEAFESGRSEMFGEYTFKMEENGDFILDLSASEEGEQIGAIKLDGKYTEKDMFFTLAIDSFKLIEDDETVFDIGLHISFEPINGVIKPSSSIEYDIWEMDEEQFAKLTQEIDENIEKIEDTLEDILK